MSTTSTREILSDVEVHGECDPRFGLVRDALATNLRIGEDIGSSAAVFLDGEPVVDVWGGYADEARTQPWERDTIVNTFSTTKTMTALCALILGQSWRARPQRAGRQVLAGVCRRRQRTDGRLGRVVRHQRPRRPDDRCVRDDQARREQRRRSPQRRRRSGGVRMSPR